MNDSERLLDGGADDFERRLLASALPDRGSDRALQRVLVAVGAGGAGLAATTAAAGASPGFLSMIIKWGSIGLISGALTSVSVSTIVQAVAPAEVLVDATPRERSMPAARQDSRNVARPAAIEDDLPAAPKSASLAQPPSRAARVETPEGVAPVAPSIAAFPSSPSKRPSDLVGETQALDQANAALQRGDSRAALAALERRDKAYPRGMLGPEATVLRVQVLLASGDRAGAESVARDFLARSPEGAHAARIRSLLGKKP